MKIPTINVSTIVNNVSASMRAEGYVLSAETRRNCAAVAAGKESASQLIEKKLAAYKAGRK